MLKFYESLSDGDVLTNNVLVISGQTLKETTIKRPVQKHDWFTMTLSGNNRSLIFRNDPQYLQFVLLCTLPAWQLFPYRVGGRAER